MVVWIIGISGSGKSTLALAVEKVLVSCINNLIILDDDVIRSVFQNDLVIDNSANIENLLRYKHGLVNIILDN